MTQESRLLDGGRLSPLILHRQDCEIAGCAKLRAYRLGSVKMLSAYGRACAHTYVNSKVGLTMEIIKTVTVLSLRGYQK